MQPHSRNSALDPLAKRTLGELVAEMPARAPIMESLRFDYCCHGGRTLEEVCRQQGLNVDDIAQRLENPPTPPQADAPGRGPHDDRDWRAASVDELIDHIESVHHAFLRRELPRIDTLAAKVADHHGERDPRLNDVRSVFRLMRAELEMHMIKEEQVLFPFGRRLAAGDAGGHPCGTVRNPVAAMLAEHDDAASSLDRMRHLTEGFKPPPEACHTYRDLLASLTALEADLHVHIHEENNVLFPRLVAYESANQ